MGILILAVAICSLYLIYVSKTKKDKSKVQEAPEKIEPTTNIEIVQEVELPVKKTRKPAAKKPAAKKPEVKKPAAKKPAAKKTKAEPAKPKKSKK
jgi:type IV secretory pathway VirB10-like protein